MFPKYVFAAYNFQTVAGEAFDTVTTNVNWTNDTAQTGYPTDDDYELVNIGFTFYLGETAYTQVRILSNGALHFGANQGFHKDFSNEALAITGACTGTCPGFEEPADRTILGYWDDLDPSSGGVVRYDTLGTGPNRRFVASWQSVARYNDPSLSYSFQIVIFEDGTVRFRYGNDNANGSSATIGIEVDDTDFTQVSFNTVSVSDANDILWIRNFPSLNSAVALCGDIDTVTLNFAGPVSPLRAADPSNFSIDNGITVLSSTYINSTTIELTTSPLNPLLTYNVSTIFPNQSVSFSFATITNSTFIDLFNSPVYSNNDGTSLWTGNWVEIADDGNPVGGNVLISGGDLVMDDRPNTGGAPSIYREADLSAATSAILTFDYSTSGNLENTDIFDILASPDGGASYTVLGTIINDASGSASYDISAFIASNTRIRFTIRTNYGGGGEFMSLDNVTITTSESTPCPTVDHYLITHDGTGLTCETESVTISACMDASCATLSTNSVSLDFQADAVTENSPTFTGSTVVDLNQVTPDTLTLSIAYPTVGADNPLVCDSGGGGTSCDITFLDTAFKFYGDAVVDNIGNQIGGKASNLAPGNQTITIRAIQADPSTGQCDALINNATQDVGFAYQCDDPATCAVPTNGMSINSQQIIDQVASGYTDITVNFDATGTGTIIFNYLDAGRITILANADVDIDATTVNVQGNSNSFRVRPFAFDLQVTGNPNATSASDPIFTTAGAAFGTTVRSILWQAADDLDNDGVADNGATLSDNGVTLNIDNITGTVALSPVAQVVVNNGAFGVPSFNYNTFTSGTRAVSQSWSEVGIVTMNADSTFMVSGGSVSGSRTNVGRFIPDHFNLTSNAILAQCGTFTYGGFFDGINPGLDKTGQLFSVSGNITAQNSSNATTLNYAGAFAKLTNANISLQEYNVDLAANDSGLVSFSPAALSFTNGVSAYSDLASNFLFETERAAFNLRLDLTATDSDSASGAVSSNSFEVRLGRLILQDSFGPEIAPLEMRLKSEYFDGTEWISNSNDSCTTYDETMASFDAASYTDNLSAGETSISVIGTQTFVTGLSSIDNGLWFTAPSPPANNYGTVKVELDLTGRPWLQYDWDSDNTIDTVNGTLSFGYYRGSDRVIYWQESN